MLLLGTAKDTSKSHSSEGFCAPWVPHFTWDLSNNSIDLLWLAKSPAEQALKLLSIVPLQWAQALACGSGQEEWITLSAPQPSTMPVCMKRHTCIPPDSTTSHMHPDAPLTEAPLGDRWISPYTCDELRGRQRLTASGAPRAGQWDVHLE